MIFRILLSWNLVSARCDMIPFSHCRARECIKMLNYKINDSEEDHLQIKVLLVK